MADAGLTDIPEREEEHGTSDADDGLQPGSEKGAPPTKYGTIADDTSQEENGTKNAEGEKDITEHGQCTDEESKCTRAREITAEETDTEPNDNPPQNEDRERADSGENDGSTPRGSIPPKGYGSIANSDTHGGDEGEIATDTEDTTSRKRQFNESGCERSVSESGSSKQRRNTQTWATSPSPIRNKRSCSSDSSSTTWKRRKPRTTDATQQTEDSLEYDQIERMTSEDTSNPDDMISTASILEEPEQHKRGENESTPISETNTQPNNAHTEEDATRRRAQRFWACVLRGAGGDGEPTQITKANSRSDEMHEEAETEDDARTATQLNDDANERRLLLLSTCQEDRGRYPAAHDNDTATGTTGGQKTCGGKKDRKGDGDTPSEADRTRQTTPGTRRKNSTTSSVSSTLSGEALLNAHTKRGPRMTEKRPKATKNGSQNEEQHRPSGTSADTSAPARKQRQKTTHRRECEIATGEQRETQESRDIEQFWEDLEHDTQKRKGEQFWEPRTAFDTKTS